MLQCYNVLFRADMTNKTNTDQEQIVSLSAELNRLSVDNKKLNSDLDSTRIERDDTVSDMRQEIERLNLLQSDQNQLATRAEKSEQHLKQQSEQFTSNIGQLRLERNDLHARVESYNVERAELIRQLDLLRNASPAMDPQQETQMIQLQSHNQVLVQKVHDFSDIIESQKTQIGFIESERQQYSSQIQSLQLQNDQTAWYVSVN